MKDIFKKIYFPKLRPPRRWPQHVVWKWYQNGIKPEIWQRAHFQTIHWKCTSNGIHFEFDSRSSNLTFFKPSTENACPMALILKLTAELFSRPSTTELLQHALFTQDGFSTRYFQIQISSQKWKSFVFCVLMNYPCTGFCKSWNLCCKRSSEQIHFSRRRNKCLQQTGSFLTPIYLPMLKLRFIHLTEEETANRFLFNAWIRGSSLKVHISIVDQIW